MSGAIDKWKVQGWRRIRQLNVTDLDDVSVGFYATDFFSFTIPDGQDGSVVALVDLGASFKVIGVECEDCSGIQAATNMTAQVTYDANSSPCDLYEQDDPGTQWDKGTLPTSGTLGFILTHCFGVRKLRLILSNPASGNDVFFKVFGFHGGS
jgi:hypothetical protein